MKPTSTDTQEIERQIGGQIGSEQAADLAALTAQATNVPAAPGATVEPEPEPRDLAAEIEGLTLAAVGILAPMFPSLPAIYTKTATAAAAAAVANVCNKHGWMQNGVMGRYGEEIACLAVVGPLAFATYQGIRGDLAARAPAQEPQRLEFPAVSDAPAPQEPAASKVVTFGAPAPAEGA